MRKNRILCLIILGAALLIQTPIASALMIKANGTVGSGGICTDVTPWPWVGNSSVQIWEDWAGQSFSLLMTGTAEVLPYQYGGPEVNMILTSATLKIGTGREVDIGSGYYWGVGSKVMIQYNSSLDWQTLNDERGYYFYANALPAPSIYIASQHDYAGDNININAWRMLSSDMSLSVISQQPVPEPATLLLVGTGLLGMLKLRKRR